MLGPGKGVNDGGGSEECGLVAPVVGSVVEGLEVVQEGQGHCGVWGFGVACLRVLPPREVVGTGQRR